MDSLNDDVDFGRVAHGLQSEHKYMIGFAWVITDELKLLEDFP